MMHRRAVLATPLALFAASARAQGFPERTVRITVPFTPAGQTDIMARLLAQRLQEDWGKPVVVENRAGGNALIGADAVAKGPADGHGLLAITLTHAVNASLFPNAPYDFLRDLTTVTLIGALPLVVVVRAESPWQDLAQLAAAAGRERLNGGSSGTGSPPHLGLELFRIAASAGERLQHVPYRGGAPSVTDLVAGNLHLLVSNLPECLGQIQSGRLRPLAVTADRRHPLLPAVPTTAEAGMAALRITSWTALQVPAATPAPVVAQLSSAILKAAAHPEVMRKAAELGFELAPLAPAESQAFVRAEVARYAGLVREAGIRAE